VVAFAQHVFNVLRFSLAWAIGDWMLFCVPCFTEAKTSRMTITLIINALRVLVELTQILFCNELYFANLISLASLLFSDFNLI